MWRFFAFAVLSLFCGVAVAQRTVLVHDTHWEKVNDHSWQFHIGGAGHDDMLYLNLTGNRADFTVKRKCANGKYSEAYWWKRTKRGEDKYAESITCRGKKVWVKASQWEGWVNPLPHEVEAALSKKKVITSL